MTTIEHAMLGINGALSAGLHRRWGWQIVALAGLAATSPDWDGAFILSQSVFLTEGHRVWGHNILACVLVGLVLGVIDYYFDLVTRCGRFLTRLLRLTVPQETLVTRGRFLPSELAAWILVAVVAMLSHLPGDIVVSGTGDDAVVAGTEALPDWEVKLLWPFSDRGWVFPLIHWGNPGITIVFLVGMFAMARWKSRVQAIALVTLLLVVAYLILYPMLTG